MSAPIGNQNAIGNSGGKTLNDRKLAADIRQLTLKKIKRILQGEDSQFQRQIILRLTGNILPRMKEVEDERSKPLQIVFDSSFNKSSETNQNRIQ